MLWLCCSVFNHPLLGSTQAVFSSMHQQTLWLRTSWAIFTCVLVLEFLWKPIYLTCFPQAPCSKNIALHFSFFFLHRYLSTFLDAVHIGLFCFVDFIYTFTSYSSQSRLSSLTWPHPLLRLLLSPRTVILQFRGKSIIGVFTILLM